jgi:hypothetical protein
MGRRSCSYPEGNQFIIRQIEKEAERYQKAKSTEFEL